MEKSNLGFTLVEFIAVLVILGIMSASAIRASLPTLSMQVQASRDQLITSFFAAQQRAMSQTRAVRLIVVTPNQIDVREDRDNDGDFSDEQSLMLAGTRYPILLLPSQTVNSANFDFNRLGETTPTTLAISQDGVSVDITISASGYIF